MSDPTQLPPGEWNMPPGCSTRDIPGCFDDDAQPETVTVELTREELAYVVGALFFHRTRASAFDLSHQDRQAMRRLEESLEEIE